MAISDVSGQSFSTELMKLCLSIVWKHESLAVTGEVGIPVNDVESYIVARKGELNFGSVAKFHPQVLQAFFPVQADYDRVALNKRNIPLNMRDQVVAAEQAYIIHHWENEEGEPNPYYRMLWGLPPKDTEPSKFIYNTAYADIDMTTPVHQLEYADRLILEKRGFFDSILAKDENHQYDYLKFIGKRRIAPYIARQAGPFEIIGIGNTTLTKLKADFLDVYEEARHMVVRMYYSDAYRNKDSLYERFLAMMVLFIAQERMCSKYMDTTITRDFYDLESLKVTYEAYGFPFYSSIPLIYHQKIVKRLNELISYKGSTQVFYDIFNIFDFGTMDVFEYFLVKRRLRDIKGNPIFRDIYNRPLPKDKQFELRFARVPWKSDKFVEVTNVENIVNYDELTVPDPYWVEDDALQQKLYERDWNYYHSKYMGVQIMFDLNQLIFETCYFLRMLEDNRGTTQDILTYYPVTGKDIPLFDMVVYAVALLCKNAGYTGEIPSDPASIAAVYGFNFKEYNTILKMTVEDMNTFIINFKAALGVYIADNPILEIDNALKFWVDQVTDGAFEYLGNDFDFGGHNAPPPMFLKDFIPTNNSIINLKEYLSQTIKALEEDPNALDTELRVLYQFLVTDDDFEYHVREMDVDGAPFEWNTFVLKKFNFTDEDVETLRRAILVSYQHMLSWIIKLLEARRALTFDPHILDFIKDMSVDDLKDVDQVYRNIKELDEYLTYKIQRVHTKTEYDAYANLRKILLTTSLMNETFAKRNGEPAETYATLLSEINPELYNRLMDEEIDANTEEQYVIQTLMNLCDELQLLQAINPTNLVRIIEYLMKILRFLKSAKVDLVNFEIIYMLTDRSANYLKFLSEIWSTDIEDDHLKDEIYWSDILWATKVFQIIEDRYTLVDPKLACRVLQQLRDFVYLVDTGYMEIQQELRDSYMYWFDWVTDIYNQHQLREELNLTEKVGITVLQRIRDDLPVTDTFKPPEELLEMVDRDKFALAEQLALEVERIAPDLLSMTDTIHGTKIMGIIQDIIGYYFAYRSQDMDQQLRDTALLKDRAVRESLKQLRDIYALYDRDHDEIEVNQQIRDRYHHVFSFVSEDATKFIQDIFTLIDTRHNLFELVMGGKEKLKLSDHNCEREVEHVRNDAIMWHETLIKLSEELVSD